MRNNKKKIKVLYTTQNIGYQKSDSFNYTEYFVDSSKWSEIEGQNVKNEIPQLMPND